MGELNGVRGLVPSNFLTEAPGQNQGQPPQGSRRPGGQSQGPGARGPPPPPREPPPAGHRRGKGKHAIRYHSYTSNPPYSANYQGMNSSSSQNDIGINCMFCTERKLCWFSILYIVTAYSGYYMKKFIKNTNFFYCIYLIIFCNECMFPQTNFLNEILPFNFAVMSIIKAIIAINDKSVLALYVMATISLWQQNFPPYVLILFQRSQSPRVF